MATLETVTAYPAGNSLMVPDVIFLSEVGSLSLLETGHHQGNRILGALN